MEQFTIRIEQPSGWLALIVAVIPGEDAGWIQHVITEGLIEGQVPYKLLVWLPEWFHEHGDDAELDMRADMASSGRRLENGDTCFAYRIIVRPGR